MCWWGIAKPSVANWVQGQRRRVTIEHGGEADMIVSIYHIYGYAQLSGAIASDLEGCWDKGV